MIRPDWHEYFANIALVIAERADCSRSQVGAVIVKDKRIVATGYNGAPAGQPGCLEGACPRAKHLELEVGSSYDSGNGTCIAIHAEANAIIYADRDHCNGASMFITREPCTGCVKLIQGAGIRQVFWPGGTWFFD